MRDGEAPPVLDPLQADAADFEHARANDSYAELFPEDTRTVDAMHRLVHSLAAELAQSSRDALQMLHAATVVAHACIADPDRETPEELAEVAYRLHDIIFDLQDPRAARSHFFCTSTVARRACSQIRFLPGIRSGLV